MSGPNAVSSHADLSSKFGYLLKRGEKNTGLKKRFFQLRSKDLNYYKSHEDHIGTPRRASLKPVRIRQAVLTDTWVSPLAPIGRRSARHDRPPTRILDRRVRLGRGIIRGRRIGRGLVRHINRVRRGRRVACVGLVCRG